MSLLIIGWWLLSRWRETSALLVIALLWCAAFYLYWPAAAAAGSVGLVALVVELVFPGVPERVPSARARWRRGWR